MKLSKPYLCLGLTLCGLLSFAPVGYCSEVPIDGGLDDLSNPKAAKVIGSDNIKEFSLRFTDEAGRGAASNDEISLPPFPAGDYLLEAVRKGEQAHFLLTCDRQNTITPLVFQKDLPAEALQDLQAIIKKYNLAAINGSDRRNSALGTSLSLKVLYDTNEKISVYAEGGASTLPQGWCGTDVFLDFFIKKLDAESLLSPSLYSCIYSRSNSENGLLYSLELETDKSLPRKQAIFKKILPRQTADNPFGEYATKCVTVSKDKLESIENIIAKYHMRNWKGLPNREKMDDNADFISIVFNYSGGDNICLDSDQELPPEYQEAFEAVHQAMTDAEKAALPQPK